jgi:hypothetical protein
MEMRQLEKGISVRMDKFQRIKEYDAMVEECKLLSRLSLWKQARMIAVTIVDAEKDLQLSRDELAMRKKEHDDREKFQQIIDMYTQHAVDLRAKLAILELLDAKFVGTGSGDCEGEGYKEWVYRTHVVPVLETHVNMFLAMVDDISLSIKYTNKSFQYLVMDRGNTPTLGMASGYQRFIISLALRIAFAKIGATGQNLGHLFIDEGFVACDAVNLDKVNGLLKNIMMYGGYTSIMLMSHLDTIRSAADMVIDIERTGRFSYIHHGRMLQNDEQVQKQMLPQEIKKRGRMKKTGV